MKKLLILFICFFVILSPLQAENNTVLLKLGFSPKTQITSELNYSSYKEDFKDDIKDLILAAEYFKVISKDIDLGIGVSIMRHNIYEKAIYVGVEDLVSTNIYLTPKYYLYNGLYSLGQIGCGIPNISEGKYTLGLYYGIGVGYEYKKVIFELLYAGMSGAHPKEYNKETIKYTSIILNIGYKFEF
jgi:hypothetical protein